MPEKLISGMCKAAVSVDRIGQVMKAEEKRDEAGAKTPPTDREIRLEHLSIGYGSVPVTLRDIGMEIRGRQLSFCFR